MKASLKIRLIIMMFLMFFTWGAWYGQMSKYLINQLNANGDEVGNAYMAFSLATIIAPFFVGMIADRFFSAQKVMGVLNFLGAGVIFLLIQEKDPSVFFWYILAYTMTFTPNLALANSIAMNHMANPDKEFPFIRVLAPLPGLWSRILLVIML